MRNIRVAAAQLGPIQKADTRQAVVARMLDLMRQAQGCDLIVYPELALTTFFPRWYAEDRSEADIWFEREMPSAATRPLFAEAKRASMAMSFGYAELTPDGHHFNTSILVDKAGAIVGKYRKVHLPGHDEFDPQRTHQHLEKRYFEPGDVGFPAWRTLDGVFGMCICNDRRWPETFRVLGLHGVEMVMLGYNTPTENIHHPEPVHLRMFHHLVTMQANAYQNGTWVLAAAKAGKEDGFGLIGGSAIIAPTGEIAARTLGEDDEVITATLDLELGDYIKRTIFNFEKHRRIKHYRLITERTGARTEV